MDALDQKLLVCLDRNPKAPQSELAKELKVSQQVVNYRINGLSKSGAISKFGTVINFLKLGFEQYRIFLKFRKLQSNQPELFDYFSHHPNIYWAARVGSAYDFLVVLVVKNHLGLEQFIEGLNGRFPDTFKDYDATFVYEHEFFDHSFYSSPHRRPLDRKRTRYQISKETIKLDEIDTQILDQIKDNCRKPALAIGNELKISYKTVQKRIKKMEERKVIAGYRIFIKSGQFAPYIVLAAYPQYIKELERRMFAEVSQIPEFTQIVRLFGTWNLFLHARCASNERLQDLVVNLREKYNFRDFQIIPIFKDIIINLFPH